MNFQLSIDTGFERKSITRVGVYASFIAFLGAAGYSIAQLLQIMGVIVFPLDAILIFGCSLCIAVPYLIALIAIHQLLPSEKKFWSLLAIAFGVMYAVYVNLDYVVQLATVIHASLP